MSSSLPTSSDNNDEDSIIELVHSKRGTNIYRHGKFGYKVLMCDDEAAEAALSATAAVAAAVPETSPAVVISEEQILRLVREQTISRYLPNGCRKRRVVDVKGFKGNPSLYFEWVEGVSLKEWMARTNNNHGDEDNDGNNNDEKSSKNPPHQDGIDFMKQRLKVAIAITKSLQEFHYGGVAYNFLTLEHIILQWTSNNDNDDDKNNEEGECVASLINLSKATVFAEVTTEEATQAIRKDLNSLGLILGALFSKESDVPSDVKRRLSDNTLLEENEVEFPVSNGNSGCDEDEGERPGQVKKRGKQQKLGDGLPIYLCSLISALIGYEEMTDSSELYDNASNVLKDLELASRKPLLLVPDVEERDRKYLALPTAFYGRRNEVALLTRSLQSVAILGKTNIAVISGRGGVGKTTLINQIRKPLEDINGYFIQAKFNLTTPPDTVIFSALDSFIDNIASIGSEKREVMELKQRIKESLDSDISVIANSIPSITKLIDKNSSKNTDAAGESTIQQQEQMKCILCKLIGAIGTRQHPIVIFLDDLQWAGKTSLDVIKMITVSPDISHCFFLACYRDNDSAMAKPVETMLDEIQCQDIPVIRIPLGRLELDKTNEFISDTLSLPPNLKSVQLLANIVHHKTGGLIFYMKNFLHELYDEGLLRFTPSRRWQFDLSQITQKEISDDVVQHLMRRMERVAFNTRYLLGLRIASCLGFSFKINILQKATNMEGSNLDGFIQFAVNNGFIQHVNHGKMNWAHDNIQMAAYNSIPESKIEAFHLLIGSRLLLGTSHDDMDNYVFDIVEQMNKGINLIRTTEQKFDSARLNLRAGRKAMASLSFQSAKNYFVCGIEILGEQYWEIDYDLTLSLHREALEALYCITDFSVLEAVTENVLAHALCFDDEVTAHYYQMRYLTSQGKLKEVLCKCKDLLQKLGEEPLPSDISMNVVMQEFAETKTKMKGYTEEDLLALPAMTNRNKLAVMRILRYAELAAFVCMPPLAPVLTFRSVKLTLEFGVASSLSASCIASYGSWLVNQQITDVEEGFNMGRVAGKLSNRYGEEFKSRLFIIIYGLINVWRQPFQASLDMLLEGYQIGMRFGDSDNAHTCLVVYGQIVISCSCPLPQMVANFRIYCKKMMLFKNHAVLAPSIVGHLQLALTLCGSSEDAYQTYLKCPETEIIQRLKYVSQMSRDGNYSFTASEDNMKVQYVFLPIRKLLYLLYSDGSDSEIREWFSLAQRIDKQNTIFPRKIATFFFFGLIGFSFARKYAEEREEWEEVGNNALEQFHKWVENSDWNFKNKLNLLMAERCFLQDNQQNAFEQYDSAIRAARDHKFVHEEGLANAAAAKCCLHYGKKKEAMIYYAQAKDCYGRWGANALVSRIEEICRKL